MHEIVVSATVFLIILVLAWVARRRVASVHLLALALFFPLMPILRALLGGTPRPGSDAELLVLYSSVLLYGVVFFVCTLDSKALGFDRYRGWLLDLSNSKIFRIAVTVLFFAWCIRIFQWNVYGVAISGSGTAELISDIPYWLTVASSISDILSYGAFLTIAVSAVATRSKLAAVFLILELAWALLEGGRRELALYVVVLLVVAHQIAAFNYKRIAFLSVVGVVFLWVVSPAFITFRESNSENLSRGFPPIDASIAAAKSTLTNCISDIDCGRSVAQNVVERPNVLEFLREVVSARHEGYPLTYGEASVVAVIWATPSLFIEKPEFMSEQFIQSSFGMAITDGSSSVLALAYADFGILGVVAFAAALAAYFSVLMRVAKTVSSKFFGACISFSVISMMWNLEIDPTAYIVTARDIALIYFFLWLIAAIKLKRRIVRFSGAVR